jgi:hypothetical protein
MEAVGLACGIRCRCVCFVSVAPHAIGNVFSYGGSNYVLSVDELEKMKVPYLPQSVVENGAPLFRELEMGRKP